MGYIPRETTGGGSSESREASNAAREARRRRDEARRKRDKKNKALTPSAPEPVTPTTPTTPAAPSQSAADLRREQDAARREQKRREQERERERQVRQNKSVISFQASQEDRLAAADKNFEGLQEGYTQGAAVEAAGDFAGAVGGGLAGQGAKLAVRGLQKLDEVPDNQLTFQQRAFRDYGRKAAKNKSLTGIGLLDNALDFAAGLLPGGKIAIAGAKTANRANATVEGPRGERRSLIAPSEREREAQGQSTASRGAASGSAAPSEPAPITKPKVEVSAPSTPKVSVKSVSPGIGISKGTDERAPSFSGSIVVRRKNKGTGRGRV